jgi:hypothetical protein
LGLQEGKMWLSVGVVEWQLRTLALKQIGRIERLILVLNITWLRISNPPILAAPPSSCCLSPSSSRTNVD